MHLEIKLLLHNYFVFYNSHMKINRKLGFKSLKRFNKMFSSFSRKNLTNANTNINQDQKIHADHKPQIKCFNIYL